MAIVQGCPGFRLIRAYCLPLFCILIQSFWVGAAGSTSSQRPPNIVLVVFEATRFDHIGVRRSGIALTPNVDRLAAEGVSYANCVAAAPWTLPSMTSLFTGLPPRDHGVDSQHWLLSETIPTLAQRLREIGYQTAGFSTNAWVGKVSGLERGFDEFVEVWRSLSAARTDDGAEIVNEWALDWVDENAAADRPLFLFVMYFEPHFPYNPPPGWGEKVASADLDVGLLKRLRLWRHPREVGYVIKAPGQEVGDREFAGLRALYDGEIAYSDFRFGELEKGLRSRGILENSVVVFTADHGESFGEHGFMDHKMTVYDEVVRVPLVIRYPGRLSSGAAVRDLVQNTDLTPTLLAWAGVDHGTGDARLEPDREGGVPGRRSGAFVEFARPGLFLDIMRKSFPGANATPFDRSLTAVTTGREKLIWASDGRHELYDLESDPAESRNLFDSRLDLRERLTKLMDAFRAGETR